MGTYLIHQIPHRCHHQGLCCRLYCHCRCLATLDYQGGRRLHCQAHYRCRHRYQHYCLLGRCRYLTIPADHLERHPECQGSCRHHCLLGEGLGRQDPPGRVPPRGVPVQG